MTVVNLVTGELVEPMDADTARRLTERIRVAATNYTEAKAKVLQLVDEAKAGQAHIALGYVSWTAYLSDVLSDEPLRLARDERKELVGRLAGEGMSTRAIAPIVGASVGQVHADRSEMNSRPEAPARPASVTSLDGRERPAARREQPKPVEPKPSAITPKAAPRRALTDQFFDAFYDLTKAVERVERLGADDRFPQNAGQVTAKHRSDLTRSIDALSRVLNRFNN